MGMVKKRNKSCLSCAETWALKWCCWKQDPKSSVTFWTFPGPCPLCEFITWASSYMYLARSWEKHKPFKLTGGKQKLSLWKHFVISKKTNVCDDGRVRHILKKGLTSLTLQDAFKLLLVLASDTKEEIYLLHPGVETCQSASFFDQNWI